MNIFKSLQLMVLATFSVGIGGCALSEATSSFLEPSGASSAGGRAKLAEKPEVESTRAKAYNNSVKYDPILTKSATSSAGAFNSGIHFLADQIERNSAANLKIQNTVLTSITDLHNPNKTSHLGRLITEHMLHQLHIAGWNVFEMRKNGRIKSTNEGGYILTRHADDLEAYQHVDNVISGTYSMTNDGVLVNMRVLNLKTGQLVSSAQMRYLEDDFIHELSQVEIPLKLKTSTLKTFKVSE
jgi:TolB-like protein